MNLAIENQWLTAAECAQRLGISVRALRHYEHQGLVLPRRTDKRWRLYGASEIVRLNEVIMLKALGLSLAEIRDLVKGRPVDLDHMLSMQRDSLRDAVARAERGLAAIDAALDVADRYTAS